MMYDIQNQLSVVQSFVASAVSTNSYQKQTAAQDISIGRMISLLVMATVAAGAGSTHVLEAIMADDAALTVNVTSLGTVTVLAADLIPGIRYEVPIPKGSLSQQFIGFRNTITGGTTTVTLDVYLMPSDEIAFFKPFVNPVPVLV